MRQPADDRALYLRQLRATVATAFLPELTSATAIDAAGLVDRILAEFIVEEEWAEALSQEFGAEFEALLGDATAPATAPVTPDRFDELRRQAAEVVAATGRQRCRRATWSCADASSTSSAASSSGSTSSVVPCFDEPQRSRRRDLARRSAPCHEGAAHRHTSAAASRPRPALEVTAMEVVPGGRSKETILVSLTGTTELPAEVIVRKDRPVGILQTRAADEFAVLQAVLRPRGRPGRRGPSSLTSWTTHSAGARCS